MRKTWSSKGLQVSGRLASGATGRVTVTYKPKRGKRTRLRGTATVRAGRFVIVLRTPRKVKGVRGALVVTYGGDERYRRETAHAMIG